LQDRLANRVIMSEPNRDHKSCSQVVQIAIFFHLRSHIRNDFIYRRVLTNRLYIPAL
jgi:hypothetical protein